MPKKHKADPWLGGWVAAIRRNKHDLSDIQIAELDKLSFPWVARRQCGSAFMKKCQQLGRFRETHGHFDVFLIHGVDHELALWVHTQRQAVAEGSLSLKRLKHLEEINFFE